MMIDELELSNIRSYEHARIAFDEGLTLLAGDIGAGKSTLLLALEFALFGTRRGEIGGEGLLRRGEAEGSVTLRFSLDRPVTVHRTLKRTGQGVRQDGGWLELDGRREELTAQELKARIFALLGYPDALVTKTKGLVFRYTVYTPQEEMKQILQEGAEQRLNTLRTVFGVDDYRTVSENAGLVARLLREQQRYLEGQVAEIADLERERAGLAEREGELSERLLAQRSEAAAAKEALSTAEDAGRALQAAYEAEQERRRKLEAITARLEALAQQRERLDREEARLAEVTAPDEAVDDPSERLAMVEAKRDETVQKRAEAEARLAHARREHQAVQRPREAEGLETCPVCEQPVSAEHKHRLRDERGRIAAEHEVRIQKLTAFAEKARGNLEALSERLSSLREQKRRHEEYLARLRRAQEAVVQRERLVEERGGLASETQRLSLERSALAESSFDEAAYREHRSLLESCQKRSQNAAVALARSEESLSALRQQSLSLERRLAEKRVHKRELQDRRAKERWLSEAFLPVVGEIERRVLASIHAEFSRRFTEWFGMLVADDALFGALGPDFAPVLTQDGYDADIAHLSGGERTAVALAYRLALNTVVNEFLPSMRTSDVLVLDEPTDGFSTEQLDRVRDVLRELPGRQVLIVSHEQKMEALVDRVLRVEKVGGVSTIA